MFDNMHFLFVIWNIIIKVNEFIITKPSTLDDITLYLLVILLVSKEVPNSIVNNGLCHLFRSDHISIL